MNTFTRFFILGDSVGLTPEELTTAARRYLDWLGSSESDRYPAEYCVSEDVDADDNATGRWHVLPTWGKEVSHPLEDAEPESTHDTESAAIARAAELNAAALTAAMESADWFTSPVPLTCIHFPGCDYGQYPRSRSARLYATLADGSDIIATGHGNARIIRELHCADALCDAAKQLIASLTIAAESAAAAAAIHDSLTADQQREALARVIEGEDGRWRVQLDLHGDDMSEDFDTENEAIREAERAVSAGEIHGTIA